MDREDCPKHLLVYGDLVQVCYMHGYEPADMVEVFEKAMYMTKGYLMMCQREKGEIIAEAERILRDGN